MQIFSYFTAPAETVIHEENEYHLSHEYGRNSPILKVDHNGVEYTKYEGWYDKSEKAPTKLWHPLIKLKQLSDSSGYFITRSHSYYPIPVLPGLIEFSHAINTLITRSFLNRNEAYFSDVVLRNDIKHIMIERHGLQPVSLSCFQRLILGAAAVVNMVRGAFCLFGLGFVFIPIDMLDSAIYCEKDGSARRSLLFFS